MSREADGWVYADDTAEKRVEEKPKREHEPVAWMFVNEDGECEQIEYGPVFDDPGVTPLYAAPPKREWVGLTDEEVNELVARFKRYSYVLLREVEAKLKEKNNA